MSKKLPILRVAGPTVFVSLVLFAACTATAIFLYRLHASSAEILTDDIDSGKIADLIATKVGNLIAHVRAGRYDQVEQLFEELDEDKTRAFELANTEKEHDMVEQFDTGLKHFMEIWERLDDLPAEQKNREIKLAIRVLESEARPQAVQLYNYNSKQIDESEKNLRRTVKWIAWALVIVGSVGSLGGILLGYGVARALRQSIYQLSVRIRDAADRLRQDIPTVTIEKDGIDFLNEQMQYLVREIDQVVARLHQREREVLRAEQLAAVGQLAAGVAHELRNPLTAVKMLVQTSREELEAKGVASEDLQIIEHEIRRLERCLQTFLDFARPPKMERRTVDLSGIIDQAFALINGRAKKQKVELRFVPPPAPVILEADADQVRQLLVNLAMNALDAMPHGGQLSITAARAGNNQVEVRVTDTGPGIAHEVMPRLFEPFASGKETGLGLGLVVSRRIAEEHGGTLEADNVPHGGACFVLRLPTPVATAA